MDAKLKARIDKLEKRAGCSEIYGIREAGYKPVKISGSDEVLPDTDAFFAKYPDAMLIIVEYASSPADIVVRWIDGE